MKKIVSLILIVVVLLALALPVAAADVNSVVVNDKEIVNEYDASPRWEVTGWYFRVNNGVLEQRLWSYTFRRWVTDWHPAW